MLLFFERLVCPPTAETAGQVQKPRIGLSYPQESASVTRKGSLKNIDCELCFQKELIEMLGEPAPDSNKISPSRNKSGLFQTIHARWSEKPIRVGFSEHVLRTLEHEVPAFAGHLYRTNTPL